MSRGRPMDEHPPPVPVPSDQVPALFAPTRDVEPCGALVVTRWVEGNEADVQWCHRTAGVCPFTGAGKSRSSERPCAATSEGREAP